VRAKSWDETRAGDFLAISNYRRIQALELEAFFVALGSGKAASEVPHLLTPGRPVVAMRVLPFLCGGIWPWPYGPDEFDRIIGRSGKRGMILKDEAKRVWELVDSGGDEIRKIPRTRDSGKDLEKGTIYHKMSYIDTFDHQYVGSFAGLPIYHPLTTVRGSGGGDFGLVGTSLSCFL